MPHYRAPGVNVEETGTGVRPIEAASTSTVAFVGATSSGPFDTPTVVESLAAYVRVFGPVSIERPVSLAVTQFFANGGRRACIVRVKCSATRKDSPRSSKYVIGDADSGTGIHALRDAGPFGLLLTPDQAEMGVAEAGRLA